jgi:hypothetical protein
MLLVPFEINGKLKVKTEEHRHRPVRDCFDNRSKVTCKQMKLVQVEL